MEIACLDPFVGLSCDDNDDDDDNDNDDNDDNDDDCNGVRRVKV